MSDKKFSTAVIGLGLIGKRRAMWANMHQYTKVTHVVDINANVARQVASEHNSNWDTEWKNVVNIPDVDIVIVSTTNKMLLPIARTALKSKKHVLIEKPMCRNYSEALELYKISQESKGFLKIGFNHRYHPGIQKAYNLLKNGDIGDLMNIISRYGHGGRPGYDKEWRGNKELSGGGELLDQGVHIIDLINWFMGPINEVYGCTARYFWDIGSLEDNAMAILKNSNNNTAMFHTSWTQWKNLFNFEIYGTEGYLAVNGLGGSYGVETLTFGKRNVAGGSPVLQEFRFEETDVSWREEWDDFIHAITNSKEYIGTPKDGLESMKIIDALYSSSLNKKSIAIL
jgi:predicted dehydrogenase